MMPQKNFKLFLKNQSNVAYRLKEVAVAFSGGLDSSLVAYLASKLGLKVNFFM